MLRKPESVGVPEAPSGKQVSRRPAGAVLLIAAVLIGAGLMLFPLMPGGREMVMGLQNRIGEAVHRFGFAHANQILNRTLKEFFPGSQWQFSASDVEYEFPARLVLTDLKVEVAAPPGSTGDGSSRYSIEASRAEINLLRLRPWAVSLAVSGPVTAKSFSPAGPAEVAPYSLYFPETSMIAILNGDSVAIRSYAALARREDGEAAGWLKLSGTVSLESDPEIDLVFGLDEPVRALIRSPEYSAPVLIESLSGSMAGPVPALKANADLSLTLLDPAQPDGRGTVSGKLGAVRSGNTWVLQLSARGDDLNARSAMAVLKATGINLDSRSIQSIGGQVSFDLNARANRGASEETGGFTYSGTIGFESKELSVAKTLIRDLAGSARFGPEDLSGQVSAEIDGQEFTLTGRTVNGRVEASLRTGEVPLEALHKLVPGAYLSGLNFLGGTGSMSLDLSGDLASPSIQGNVRISGGIIRHQVLPDLIKGIRADLEFSEDAILVRELEGELGEGKLTGSGKVRLHGGRPSFYQIAFSGQGIRYSDPVLSAGIDFEAELTGASSAPTLSGTVRLKDAEVAIQNIGDWGERFSFGGDESTTPVRFDIRLLPQKRFRISGAGVDILADGSLIVGGTSAEPRLSGRLTALSGSLVYLGTRFRVTGGAAEFYPENGFIPSITMEGRTRIGRTDLNLQISGPADGMSFELTSNPPMSQEEILAMISIPGGVEGLLEGGTGSGFMRRLFDFLNQQVGVTVLGGIEKALRDALNLDDVTIYPDYDESEVDIRLGKYILDNVYLTYERTLGPAAKESIKLDYTLRPGLVVSTGFDSEGEIEMGLEGKIRF